jgi:hypothetical protein
MCLRFLYSAGLLLLRHKLTSLVYTLLADIKTKYSPRHEGMKWEQDSIKRSSKTRWGSFHDIISCFRVAHINDDSGVFNYFAVLFIKLHLVLHSHLEIKQEEVIKISFTQWIIHKHLNVIIICKQSDPSYVMHELSRLEVLSLKHGFLEFEKKKTIPDIVRSIIDFQ